MLGLKLPTDPRWVNLAEISIEEILVDHAYCEQKAASTVISIIQKYPEYKKVVEALAPIVTEEWGHFRMVLKELDDRNMTLGKQRKDIYVDALIKNLKRGGGRVDQLVERLLMSALIEARSCERFRLLSEGLEDPYLKKFYHKFMVSEAGHYTLFIELASSLKDEKEVRERWQEWLDYEKELLANIEVRGDRMH